MGWLSNSLSKFKDWIGGYDNEDNSAYVNKAAEATKAVKSTEQLANEGRSAAGIAAADKAGEAKKAAKAAAMQNGGGRLAAATSGANAAANASAQGYAETANQMTGVASGQNAAKVGAISGEANALQTKAANRQNAKNTFTTNYGAPAFQQGLKTLNGGLQSVMSSDASKKTIQVGSTTGVATTNYQPDDFKITKKKEDEAESATEENTEDKEDSDTRKKHVYIPKEERGE